MSTPTQRRLHARKPLKTRQGEYGTLYRFVFRYRDGDPACPEFTWATWAYDTDHAWEKWHGGHDSDGWTVLSVRRTREG